MNSLKQIRKIDFLKIAEIIAVIAITVVPVASAFALSSGVDCNQLGGVNCNAGTSVNGLITTVIRWMLGIAFGIAVLFLIIGGFQYITSAGNAESAEKGKNTAVNALIGIVIIVLSYVIVSVVSNLVSNAGTGTSTP